MRNVFLKPALDDAGKSKVVPDPQNDFRPLAGDGEWKPLTNYWVRRLRDGDVIETAAPAAAPTKRVPGAGSEPEMTEPRSRRK